MLREWVNVLKNENEREERMNLRVKLKYEIKKKEREKQSICVMSGREREWRPQRKRAGIYNQCLWTIIVLCLKGDKVVGMIFANSYYLWYSIKII